MDPGLSTQCNAWHMVGAWGSGSFLTCEPQFCLYSACPGRGVGAWAVGCAGGEDARLLRTVPGTWPRGPRAARGAPPSRLAASLRPPVSGWGLSLLPHQSSRSCGRRKGRWVSRPPHGHRSGAGLHPARGMWRHIRGVTDEEGELAGSAGSSLTGGRRPPPP